MADVSLEKLRSLADEAAAVDSPRVDIAPLLNAEVPVYLQLHALHGLISGALPSLSLDVGNVSFEAQPKDGGAMFSFTLKV